MCLCLCVLCVTGLGGGRTSLFHSTGSGLWAGHVLCCVHVLGASVCVEGCHRCGCVDVRAVQGWRERVASSFAEVDCCASVRALCVGVVCKYVSGGVCVCLLRGGVEKRGRLICYSTLCAPSSRTRSHLHCPMPKPSSLSCIFFCRAHCPLATCCAHTLARACTFKCTLAHSPVHTCLAVQSPLQLLVKPPPPTPPPHRCGMHALTCTTSATCTFPLFKHACPTSTQSPPLPAVTPTHPHSSLPLMFGEERAGAMACGHHAVCSPLPPPKHPPTTRECVF